MSLANSLRVIDGQRIFAQDQTFLVDEPSKPNDAARISDTIVYMGNATYPLDLSQTIKPSDASFTTLFESNASSNDYLRVRPNTDLFNFQQLANVSYSVAIDSISMSKFRTRFVAKDISLNTVKEYFAITYDPSNNPNQPPVIDGFTLNGWSLLYPKNTEYLFLEIENTDASGGGSFRFDYANSQLENAIDNSKAENLVGSRPSTDLITIDYFVSIRDASGVEKDLTILEGEVAVLQSQMSSAQTDISNLQVEVTDLSNAVAGIVVDVSGAVLKTGSTMTGSLIIDSGSNTTQVLRVEGQTGGVDFNSNVGANSLVFTRDNNVITQVIPSQNDLTVSLLNKLIVNITGGNPIVDLNSDSGGIGCKLTGINNPSGNKDAVNLQTLNSVATSKLNLSGGTMTGQLNMGGGNRIVNVANPVGVADVVNLQTLNSAISGVSSKDSIVAYNRIVSFSPTISPAISTNTTILEQDINFPSWLGVNQSIPYIANYVIRTATSGSGGNMTFNLFVKTIQDADYPINPTDSWIVSLTGGSQTPSFNFVGQFQKTSILQTGLRFKITVNPNFTPLGVFGAQNTIQFIAGSLN